MYDNAYWPIPATADRILLAVLSEIEVFGESNGHTEDGQEIREFGVPYRPNLWFDGPLPDAPRKACSRAVEYLAMAGSVKRVTGSGRDRVTHLQLTDIGLSRAMKVANGCANQELVQYGLELTDWGSGLMSQHVPETKRGQ